MLRNSLTGLDKRQLRIWLAVFFLALAIPTAILIYQSYGELKWEAFHQHRLLAEEFTSRINQGLIQLITEEEARPYTDYAFLNVAGDPQVNFLQRSPLSAYPLKSAFPGLIGHFQVDSQGLFSTPLLPQEEIEAMRYGIPEDEQQQRLALQQQIHKILSENQLVQDRADKEVSDKRALLEQTELKAKPSASSSSIASVIEGEMEMSVRDDTANSEPRLIREQEVPSQAAFDRLNLPSRLQKTQSKQQQMSSLGRVEDLSLDTRFQTEPSDEAPRQAAPMLAPIPEKRGRKERSSLPQAEVLAIKPGETKLDRQTEVRIRTFESEIDPFEFSLLNSGHFVLFRKVWRDGQRYIQGALIEPKSFLQAMIQSAFLETSLSQMSDLIIAYQGDVFSVYNALGSREYLVSADQLKGTLLYQTSLPDPFGTLELIFSINHLPASAGQAVINWVSATLMIVLCGGFYFIYRLGVKQIELTQLQQDFVSAVSHELKTPLTSIRMYGEMLREGWASEAKKSRYYDFIFDESERLSRLINNVLQLSRLSRNRVQTDLKPTTIEQLMDAIRPKVLSQLERTDFNVNLTHDKCSRAVINIDNDQFTQIIINLVDNAQKFAAKSDQKQIDISCSLHHGRSVVISVRDYGPGIPKNQLKKIFRLFYRMENELTRETVGTGIGLALVQQLVSRMHGKVDVINQDPGVEFRISFPLLSASAIQKSS